MDVNVEWTGKNKNGILMHKASDTEVSDIFDVIEDREKIDNILKKDIANFYEVDRDSIQLLKVSFKNVPKKVEAPVVTEPDEYSTFVEGINSNIDVKIAALNKEIENLTYLKNRFENLKKKIN